LLNGWRAAFEISKANSANHNHWPSCAGVDHDALRAVLNQAIDLTETMSFSS
jgi:hypothetical protein